MRPQDAKEKLEVIANVVLSKGDPGGGRGQGLPLLGEEVQATRRIRTQKNFGDFMRTLYVLYFLLRIKMEKVSDYSMR